MRIAQIAPLAESVPPMLYGGTERVVSYLTEELVRLGHQVTLFASGDSQTSAQLASCSKGALRLDPRVKDPLPHQLIQLARVRARADEFDVLHFHLEYLHYPLFRDIAAKTVTTQHGRLDGPDLQPLYREFRDMPLVSISDSQRRPLPPVNWLATVYHGLSPEVCPFNPTPRGDYFAFLGRVSPEKGLDRAIEIAQRAGVKLRIGAKIDSADERYFQERLQPMLSHPLVEYVGEVSEAQKKELLGNASGLLFPIDWPEPFGLAMIEAMSCGTPVIAWPHGSVPEIVEHGTSGFVVNSIDEAVGAVKRIGRLARRTVREYFEARFSAERMARDYLRVYQAMLGGKRVRLAEKPAATA